MTQKERLVFQDLSNQAMNAFELSQRRIQEDSKQTAKGMETGKKKRWKLATGFLFLGFVFFKWFFTNFTMGFKSPSWRSHHLGVNVFGSLFPFASNKQI